MRVRLLLSAGLVALACPAAAHAAAPIMPLSEVEPGMQCTALSVFQGQAVEPFDVEILDVVGEGTIGRTQPRLLVRVSGPRIEPSGIGLGFSGSPIFCTGADGVSKNAGAISEGLGNYGDLTVLATPIEQVIGTPVTAPRGRTSAREARRDAALLAQAGPIDVPLSLGGLAPSLMRNLRAAGERRGVALLPAPSVPADSAPTLPMQPGSAMGVGLSSGDITLSGIGTVSYVDGNRLWAYGHQFDAAGARSLFLQDAYVSTVVSNPVQADGYVSYKLAGAVHDRGTISNDGFDAVAGTLGGLPPRVGVRVVARDTDLDTRRVLDVAVADESVVDNPTGYTGLSLVAPIAVSQASTELFNSAPQRMAGRMCMRVKLRGIKRPLRFCNRYVSDGTGFGESLGLNPVALAAGTDASTALSIFDAYKGEPVRVSDVSARVTQTRAQRQAYIRNVILPRTIRRGQTVPVKLVTRVVRGPVRVFTFDWKVPGGLELGKRRLDIRGTDPDGGFGFFDELIIEFGGGGGFIDTEGPRSVAALAAQFAAMDRWDGVRVRKVGRFFRDETYRIAGRDVVNVRVRRRA